MRRTILSSVLIIGAALAVVFAGGTFSAFTDTEQIDGEVTAAIVDFELAGDTIAGNTTGTDEDTPAPDEILTITFDSLGEACTELAGGNFFAPGDDCTINVALTRDAATIAQQLAVNLSVSAFTVTGKSDLDASPTVFAIDCDNGATGGDPGAEWTITYAFEDAGGNDTFMPAATADADQQIDITVSLDAAAVGDASEAAGCQGDVLGDILITIQATQAALPHDNTDD